jgi:hypothetical protein
MATSGPAMRKLIHIAYGVLKTQTEYRPQTDRWSISGRLLEI